ncbi:MAG: alpha amylase C-terminal domain-containing protein [Caldilineaceae bacterium]|nr:alpha amylase C-terminal domain-containing protein [Caldilineaceae bacterium]
MDNNDREWPAGMGAVLGEDGVLFRVWAPNATSVHVAGSFNDWADSAHPLSAEGDGYWAGLIENAKAGDQYKYVLRQGEEQWMRIDPYAREVTNSVGNAVIYDNHFDWGEDGFEIPAWNTLVIYEMHIGTFHDDDTNDDRPSTFADACKQLPYLQALGINAIELMPPMEFPGARSWGYNPSCIFAIESDYGGPTAFKAFVKAAHEHGIAVLLDVVYNHFGPSDLDLWQFDGWRENEMGGIYFYNDHRAQTPWGATRPDYGRGEVRQFLRDNALMWLAEYRVDGLRWDSTLYMRNINGNAHSPASDIPEAWTLMQWINGEIKARFPGKISIAEDLVQNPWLTKPPAEGGAGFDAQWDSAFVHPVRTALLALDDEFRDLDAVAAAITYRYNVDAFERVIYTESHDEVANGRARVAEEITPGEADSWFAKKRSTLGAALVLTAPGIPMLFQGQELLEDRWFQDSHPVDWSKLERHGGIHQLYQDLIHLRRNLTGTTAGLCGQQVQVYHLDHANKILAYLRWDGEQPADGVVVVVNFANRAQTEYTIGLPSEGRWQVRLNSDASHYDEGFSNHGVAAVTAQTPGMDNLPCSGTLAIGPYTALILSKDPA